MSEVNHGNRLEQRRYSKDFVGYKNIVIALDYLGEGTNCIEFHGKAPEDVTRADLFREGTPIHWSDLGNVHSLCYRTKERSVKKRRGKQDIIVGTLSRDSNRGFLYEFDYPGSITLNPSLHASPKYYLGIDVYPDEILPVYRVGGYASQDDGNPDSLIVIGRNKDGGCRLIRRTFGDQKVILPDSGRWTRDFYPCGFDVNLKSERILAKSDRWKRREDLTDSLHKAGVDIERTLEHIHEFKTWKPSDGIF